MKILRAESEEKTGGIIVCEMVIRIYEYATDM